MSSGAPAGTVGKIGCSITSVVLARVLATLGDSGVAEVIARSGLGLSAEHLRDVNNWIDYGEAIAVIEAAHEVTGDPDIVRRAGEETLRQHAGTGVATLLRSLGSPERIFEQVTATSAKFTTVSEMTTEDLEPGRAVARVRMRYGYERHPLLCDYTIGLLSQVAPMFGMPPARVDHGECACRGDAECVYVVTWDAEEARRVSDPEQMIRSLEGQLAAMGTRLDSVYATARELVAPGDLDGALKRITESAAVAVRAPAYLLAVRLGAEGELRVHHRGLETEDVPTAAVELLSAVPGAAADGGRLVAEVASAERSYGRLMACSEGGGFFTEERELLEVYAGFAASVLDTASALDETRRLHDQAVALLGLSQALAATTTSEQVAARLIESVPKVIDCDTVAVHLWDERRGRLVGGALAGHERDDSEDLLDRSWDSSDNPDLARYARNPDPEPIYHDADTDEPNVREVMARFGSRAIATIPIVGHERFYGMLSVGAQDRPERLRRHAELDEALRGVGAQAATALGNARLMEQLSHDARHDNLTGLLGHRAFHEEIGELFADAEDEKFALAIIDIDDFKQVNDLYGHPAGDRALRDLARALAANVRDGDTVFRVGGEEFAVLMPGLDSKSALPVAERLRVAAVDACFATPVRVSIGVASCPRDAVDVPALIESADGALYAAKREGKDRTVLPALGVG